MGEQLVGLRETNSGATRVYLAIDDVRATLRVHARWMGRAELDVMFECEHRLLGSHSGALLVANARICGESRPLPPSDGALIIEYVRVPEQPAPLPGSASLPWSAGRWTDPYTLVLWLHPDAVYDDGSELAANEYEVPPEDFAPTVEAIRWLAQPWKLGPT
jgi:hypothetical protein